MKAILVAGGHGSRLQPFTRYTQKTLLPLFDRPVIDYALGTIRRAGIRDITIVSNQFVGQIAKHVGQGLPGERIHYVIEEEPLGVAHALNLARPYNTDARLMIYFSDNITTLRFGEHVAQFEAATAPPDACLSHERSRIPKRTEWLFLTRMVSFATSWKNQQRHRQISQSVAFTCLTNGFGNGLTSLRTNGATRSQSRTSRVFTSSRVKRTFYRWVRKRGWIAARPNRCFKHRKWPETESWTPPRTDEWRDEHENWNHRCWHGGWCN